MTRRLAMQFTVHGWRSGFRVMGLLIGCLGLPALGQEQQPLRGHYEAWSHGVPQGVAIFDSGLASDRDCVLQFLRADGSICRTLVTRLAGPAEGAPLAWAAGRQLGTDPQSGIEPTSPRSEHPARATALRA